MVTGIAKDMWLSWLEEWPDFWPDDILFTNPKQVPEIFKVLGAVHWGRPLQLLTGHLALTLASGLKIRKPYHQHLPDIRNRIWSKIQCEEDLLPFDEVLKCGARHSVRRTCYHLMKPWNVGQDTVRGGPVTMWWSSEMWGKTQWEEEMLPCDEVLKCGARHSTRRT